MTLPILHYGHPVLREKGAPVGRVTPEIRQLVSDMLDTMYEAHGIGLAAQQVGRAVRVAVLDVRGIKDRPSTLMIDGKEADVEAFMPVVLIDPEVRGVGGTVVGPEGCLSFPEMYADIERSEEVEVEATNLDGNRFRFRCGGLLARAVQHEVDHLNGVLFIDRMSKSAKAELKPELDALMAETKAALAER
jgi:peptide deformylase